MIRARVEGWLVAVLAAVLGIFAVCLVDALDWIGRPFAGFLFLENGIAVSIARADWAQTRYRDVPFARVLAVDGRPVAGGRDVHAYVAAAGVGKPITYTFRKGADIFRLAIPVRPFAPDDFLEIIVPLLAVGLLMILVSAAVVALRPAMPAARALFFVCLGIGVSMIASPDEWAHYRFGMPYFLAGCMVPPAFTHLALTYPQRAGFLDRGPAIYALLYLPFVALAGALIVASPEPSLFLPLLYCMYFLVANAAVLFLGALVVGLIDGVRPRQAVVLSLVAVLGSCVIAGAVLATYPLLQRPLSPASFLGPLLFFPIVEGIALVRFPTLTVPE
ncbi:MAG TPA: hypothetical protein VKA21_13400 [Candidatus Binatia bacterium]|nr:hypothetical protein [Candidatus Binatia bacterium]